MRLLLYEMILIMIKNMRKLENGLFCRKWSLTHYTNSQNNIQLEKIASIHPRAYSVKSTATHKDLAMILDSKLTYEYHLQPVFSRSKTAISLLGKIQLSLPRKSLIIIIIYQASFRLWARGLRSSFYRIVPSKPWIFSIQQWNCNNWSN